MPPLRRATGPTGRHAHGVSIGRRGAWPPEALLARAARRPGRGRRRPPQAWPQLLGQTSTTERALPSSAVQLRCWSRPMTTTRLPLLRDWLACSAWSRHTITVKNEASCSRRPTRPPGRWPGRCHPRCSRSSGSSVRLPAKLTLASVMVLPSCCLAGRSALPLEPGDGGHRGMPTGRQGQAAELTKSAINQARRASGSVRVPGWLVECLRLGVGHARNRPARSLHPGRGGRSRLPPRRPKACLRRLSLLAKRYPIV